MLGGIGSGFLFRQGARQLVGLIPVAGIVPRVAVAYAGTLAIGKTVVAWTTYGARSEPSAGQEILLAGALTRHARGLGSRDASATSCAPPPQAPFLARMIFSRSQSTRPHHPRPPCWLGRMS